VIPLSILVQVLDSYDNDGSFDPDCVYDRELLAAYILCQSFEAMIGERLPDTSLHVAATTVVQSWLGQDLSRWCTTYRDPIEFVTELMNGDQTLECFGRGKSMAESVINAAKGLEL